MAKSFHELRERLLRAGVAPRHVRRYLSELADHLADLTAEERDAGRGRGDAESAALLRLGGVDDLSKAMIGRRQFQSWIARAPWAIFGLAAPLVLGVAYSIALLILWSGWNFFLRGYPSPFVRIGGYAGFYFGVGRLLYYGSPLVVGWGIGWIAARQRSSAAWPAVGLGIVALMGAAAHVYTGAPIVPGGAGQVGMEFTFGPSAQSIFKGLSNALVTFSFSALPYLIWRLQKIRADSV